MFRVLDRETNQSRTTLDAQTRDELEALFRADGREGRLVCPHCMAPVLFRYSEIYVPHFSHKTLGACPFSSESLPVIRARAALYLLLKERLRSPVEIEYVVPGLKLSRPVDCWVRSKDKTFAYWLLEKGVRGRNAAIALRDMLKATGATLHFLFLAHVLRPVAGGNNAFRLTPTERVLQRRSSFDAIYSEGSRATLQYVDADLERAQLITLRSLEETNCGNHFSPAKMFWSEFGDIVVSPDTGELSHPGEQKQLITVLSEARAMLAEELIERGVVPVVRTKITSRFVPSGTVDPPRQERPLELPPSKPKRQPEHEQPELSPEAIEALRLQRQNGVVVYDNGDIEAACESCGAFTTDWMSYDGKTGLCKCNDCFQPNRKKAMEEYRESLNELHSDGLRVVDFG